MEFKNFNKFGYKVFCSEVSDGLMAMGTDEGQKNAKKFLQLVGATDPLCQMVQVHGSSIVRADRAGLFESVDGLVSDKNYTLAVKTADCIPVVFCEKKSGFFGVIHVGRKSITEQILSKSLGQKLEELSVLPEDLKVFLGPHIRQENYDLHFKSFRVLRDTKWSKYILDRSGKNYFNMTRAAFDELEKIGVLGENVIDSGIDTYCDRRFFSARKDPDNPYIRFLTVVFHDQPDK